MQFPGPAFFMPALLGLFSSWPFPLQPNLHQLSHEFLRQLTGPAGYGSAHPVAGHVHRYWPPFERFEGLLPLCRGEPDAAPDDGDAQVWVPRPSHSADAAGRPWR